MTLNELQKKLENLPKLPGVYLFKNKNDKIIYIGKAKSLYHRVKSYFSPNLNSLKTEALVSKIADLDVIVTDNEVEALILEANLIKQHKPRYNVNLKDDKSYPYIVITNEDFPQVYPTRRVVMDGSKYFGPYTEVKTMKQALKVLRDVFKIRSCKYNLTEETIQKGKYKVCLDYHIKKCDGPCEGLISKEETKKVVDIMLCLDTSTSMYALDFNPKNRFEVAKEAAKEFVKLRKNDRIGVVVFSGVAALMCPLTVDKESVLRVLDNTNIGIIKLDGTAIGSAIMQCIDRMKDVESKSKIIILLTDGRNNLGEIDPITAAKAAQSLDIKIYTIGCGDVTGKSLYIIDDPFWGKRQVYLEQDLDEPTLIQITDITGGKYFNVRTKEKMFEVFREIDKMEKTEINVSEDKEYKYLYQIPLFVSFLLFSLRIVLEKVIYLKIP
jgi:hypothetical protein